MTDYVSRAEALTATCPICQAEPGQSCFGTRGKPRATCHRDRQPARRRETRLYDLEQNYVPPQHRHNPPARQPVTIPDDERVNGLVHCHEILEQLAARGLATGRTT